MLKQSPCQERKWYPRETWNRDRDGNRSLSEVGRNWKIREEKDKLACFITLPKISSA